MVNEKSERRKQNLIEEIERERGRLPAHWAYLAEKDIDYMEAYNTLYTKGLTDGKVLPAKTRELIAIALLAFRGLENAVYEHCKRALRLGATKQELLEAMETSIIPGGAPTLSTGLRALMRIEEDEKAKSKPGGGRAGVRL
jgi:alkylhydroperoxidase/carboxymuconolactone decarboxylase family protein YurZ